MGKRPAKIPDADLVPFVRESVSSGNYRESYHHRIENTGRPAHDVTRQEVEQALLAGRREPARDRFESYRTWSYCFSGRTIDRRLIRVAVSLNEGVLFIVSAYAPERGEKD